MRNFEKNLKTTQKNTLKPLKHQIRRDLIWPHIILSHMRPKFSREGKVTQMASQMVTFKFRDLDTTYPSTPPYL